MAKYIEKEALKRRFEERLSWLRADVHDEYSAALCDGCEADMGLMNEVPVIDTVPVVRCKDCKYYKPDEFYDACTLPQGLTLPVPNDFCCFGERE